MPRLIRVFAGRTVTLLVYMRIYCILVPAYWSSVCKVALHVYTIQLNENFAGREAVPKSETRGFDSWLTSSLRIECNFPLATSDVEMMFETKFYSYATNDQNK